MPRKKDDDWVEGLIKLGIGFLAVYFLNKLLQSGEDDQAKICTTCGSQIGKWARKCPNCRTNLISW